jgi:hypothetical protein
MTKVRCNHFEDLECFLEVAHNRCQHAVPHDGTNFGCRISQCNRGKVGISTVFDCKCTEVEEDDNG